MSFHRRMALVLLVLVVTSVTARAGTLLVVNKGQFKLVLFDPETLEPIASVPTGAKPHEVVASPDGRYAYVSNYQGADNSISVIDIAERKHVGEIEIKPYSLPHGLAISNDGKKLYATAESRRCMIEIDVASRKVTRAFKTNLHITHMCAVSPDQTVLVGSNNKAGNVSIFSLATGKLIKNIVSGRGAEGIAFTPDGRYLWTTNNDANTVCVLDMDEGHRVNSILTRGGPLRIAITPDGKEAWVSLASYAKLAVFNTATQEQIAEIRVGNVPLGITTSDDGKHIYVCNQDDNNVMMIDRKEKKVLREADAGYRPDGIDWAK